MKREFGLWLLILLLLGLAGGFAWLTRHPESPWLEKAQEWPLVGDAARGFRRAYLGPEATGETAEASSGAPRQDDAEPPARQRRPPPAAPAPVGEPVVEEPLRLPPSVSGPAESLAEGLVAVKPVTPPAVPRPVVVPPPPPAPAIRYQALEWVWLLPGNRILTAADAGAEAVAGLGEMAYLPVLARDGQWLEVVHDDRRGWIDGSWEPPHPRRGARRGILRHRAEPVRGSDAANLRKARKMLGVRRSDVKVGAYTLVTDVDDADLLAFLDGAAVAAEEAYFARYGRLPSGDPLRSAVLFATEADYRRFSGETTSLAAEGFVGHAGGGILAFYAEGRPRVDLARTLIHEITHLLNDRSIAWNLPTWLEEGMATDLGSVWVEGSREVARDLELGEDQELVIQGLEGRLFLLEELLNSGRLPPLTTLAGLDRDKFHEPDVKTYAYAHSAAFVRYLLDGEDGALADGFRTFLKRIADGMHADLLKLVGRDFAQLDEGFRSWLREETRTRRELLNERYRRLVRR